MTLNNLEDHLSWFLSNKPIPTIPVPRPASENFRAIVQSLYDETLATAPESQTRSHKPSQISQPLRLEHNAEEHPQLPEPISTIQDLKPSHVEHSTLTAQMARLQSAPRNRPALLIQNQMLTPASTTVPSSLTAAYSASFSKPTTPSVKKATQQPTATSTRHNPTPQTPHIVRQTTWQTPSVDKHAVIDMLDLTEESRSGSSLTDFGEPQQVWIPEAAERPEPPNFRAKKRKSDEISGTRETKRHASRRAVDPDGFMDIDTSDEEALQSYRRSPQEVQTGVQPTVEEPELENLFEEEVSVTKTTCRTETRTRKTLSRNSSSNSGTKPSQFDPPQPMYPPPASIPQPAQCYTSPAKLGLLTSNVIKQTPRLRSPSPSLNASQRRQINRKKTVIVDSEEEHSDVEAPKYEEVFPISFKAESPKMLKQVNSWNPQVSPSKDFERSRIIKESPLPKHKVRVDDRLGTGATQQSSTKEPCVNLDQPSSQVSSSLALSNDDKLLVTQFLLDSSHMRAVENNIVQQLDRSAALIARYMEEDCVMPPIELVQERKALIEKKNALFSLAVLKDEHLETDNLVKQSWSEYIRRLDAAEDTQESQAAHIEMSKKRKEVEKKIVHLLHYSGAYHAGFRSQEGDHVASQFVPGTASSEMQQRVLLKKEAISSTYEHTETVAQTQMPFHASNEQQVKYDSSSQHTVGLMPMVDHYGGKSVDDFEDDENVLAAYQSFEITEGKCVEEDEYGDFDDDEEMLQCTTAAEQRNASKLVHTDASRQRQVFSEITSNIQTSTNQRNKDIGGEMYNSVDPENTGNMMRKPWSTELKKALKDRFKLRGFRQNQLEAINATLGGGDVFVLMPTGGGKSLCYQLPAIIKSGKTAGVTIVISPLLSLMQDQVDHLRKLRVQAYLLNGEVTADYRRQVLAGLREPRPDHFVEILYVTPEMVGKSQQIINAFSDLHSKGKIARIVIDEAHCVSQWGHDFRPDYKALGELREILPGVPVMALTATATENCKSDVIHNLGIAGCKVFTQSFNRPNLTYEIRSKKKKAETMTSIAELIKSKYRGQCGIIYALSRKDCEKIAAQLKSEFKIAAHHYHAALDPETKIRVQKEWQAGKHKVIVATIAFGMGIDKADVRFVIHHTLPKSLEGYYQETGRAGRDGKRSGCYLYYGYQDTAILQRFIDDGEGNRDQKERQRKMLNRMVQFCENKSDCRRVEILRYFNESFSKDSCNHTCDNCSSDSAFETVDYTFVAQNALSVVKTLRRSKLTVSQCVDVLRGGSSKKLQTLHRDKLRETGCASELPRGEVERIMYRLLGEEALEEYNEVNKAGFASQYIKLGPKYLDFIQGRRPLKMQVRVSNTPKNDDPSKRKKNMKAAHPQSTNVSSPVRALAKRRNKNQFVDDEAGVDGSEEDDYGSDMESFIVDDDDESDGFEPVREAGTANLAPRSRSRLALGPPITKDPTLDAANLNDTHRAVMEEFLPEAKDLQKAISVKKNLTRTLFTEMQMRQMIMHWTTKESEILSLKDIDVERVRPYARKFAQLVQRSHDHYESMMAVRDEHDMDVNHQNVIDLCSEEEMPPSEEFQDEEAGEAISDEEASRFFDPKVRDFHADVAAVSMYKKPSGAREFPSQDKPRGRSGSRGGGGNRGWKGKNKYSRKSSGSSRSRSAAGGPGASTAGANKPYPNKQTVNGDVDGGSIFKSFAKKAHSTTGARNETGNGSRSGTIQSHFSAMPT